MKNYLIFLFLLLTACQQLLKGQEQPTKAIGNNLYITTCSGMAETRGNCFEKAKKTCAGTFDIVKEVQDSGGVHRELTFECKK